MNLAGVGGRSVYCLDGTEVGVWRPGAGYRRRGSLPVSDDEGAVRTALRRPLARRLLRPLVGSFEAACLYPLSAERLLATVGRDLLRSTDGGRTWAVVERLAGTSRPAGGLPTSVAEHDGALYLAEYTLGDEPARILRSDDEGATWRPAVVRDDVRHFHGVFSDPYEDRLWATTGDSDGASAVGLVEDGAFRPVGTGSQRWRAVDLAFTRDAVVWGVDCGYAPSVELVRLDRAAVDAPSPQVRVVGQVNGPVFYAERVSADDGEWVVVSTASATGVDSTAPPSRRRNASDRAVEVLAAPVDGGLTDWRTVATFARRRTVAEHVPGLTAANAYCFLATHPTAGLLLNPFNTDERDGTLLAVDPAALVQEERIVGAEGP